MFEKLVSFTKKVADLPDRPSLNPSALKAQFDAAPDEVRVYLNKLIDALKLTTAGDSGAKNIGVTAITGLDGTDIQTILEQLAAKKIENWANVTTQNGWFHGTGDEAQYCKNSFGEVNLRGKLQPGILTNGTAVCTLPDGYRPKKNYDVIAKAGSGGNLVVVSLRIDSDGNCRLFGNPSIDTLWLNNIQFRTDS